MALTVTTKIGDGVAIGEDITVHVVARDTNGQLRLSVEAPRAMKIWRIGPAKPRVDRFNPDAENKEAVRA